MSLLVFLLIGCKSKSIPKEVKEYYPNGSLKCKYNVVDGVINGKFVCYFESGEIESEINYKDGLRQGRVNTYYKNGMLRWRGTNLNDILNGWTEYFDQNGVLKARVEYIQLDTTQGYLSYLNLATPDSSKVEVENRYIVYDKSGDAKCDSSVYYQTWIKNDTIPLGDTLFVSVDFPIRCKKNPINYIVHYDDPTINKLVSIKSDNISYYYNFVPNKKGANTIKGIIFAYKNHRIVKSLLFHIDYYVK